MLDLAIFAVKQIRTFQNCSAVSEHSLGYKLSIYYTDALFAFSFWDIIYILVEMESSERLFGNYSAFTQDFHLFNMHAKQKTNN